MENSKKYFVVGFTNVYYTLWSVVRFSLVGRDGDGREFSYEMEKVTFLQNLSMLETEAYDKAIKLSGGLPVLEDHTLRGVSSWFERRLSAKHLPNDVFTFGKLYYQKIAESNDVWQLNRARTEEVGGVRQELAKLRLITLGELVQFEGEEILRTEMETIVNQRILDQKENSHSYQNGEKVVLQVRHLASFGYDTVYGWVSIVKMEDEKGNVIIYKGGTPPSIDWSSLKDGVASIKGTIKHGEYQNKKQTLIQRIKVLEAACS